MRLGFHYHVPALLENGQILMPGYQGRFVDALADRCREVVCFLHTPVGNEREQMDYSLRRGNVRLVEMGPHCSAPIRLLFARKHARTVRAYREYLDVVLLRGPSPLLPFIAHAIQPLPTALLVVGDAVAGVKDSRQPAWRREVIRLLWKWNQRQQNRIARRALTFVNSRVLYDNLRPYVPNLHETRTTTLTRTDFFERDDTCQAKRIRLLYAGRIWRGKGLLEMVRALAALVQEGEDVVLDMVGWLEKGDDVLTKVNELAESLKVSNRIKYHGSKPAGPELFAYYQRADIYVIASKTTEGFPRTIWEAMAHSLPVVATTVGSIPAFVGEAAELVSPGSSEDLTRAIRLVIHDSERRRRMIQRGRSLAANITLETQVGVMVREIERQLRSLCD